MGVLSFLNSGPKLLLIMGKSGSGKTTLAETLEKIKPSKYKRIVQYTTRDMRENETDGVDYNFITKKTYKEKEDSNELIARVKREFPPSYYGTPLKGLEENKTNVLVVSAEGLLDTLNAVTSYGNISVLNITNVDPEAVRENRASAEIEEKYNTIIIEFLKNSSSFKKINFREIQHSKLIEIRNDEKRLLKFLKENKL